MVWERYEQGGKGRERPSNSGNAIPNNVCTFGEVESTG